MPSPKFLPDGVTPNPNYRADRHKPRTGDRHTKRTGDRHTPESKRRYESSRTVFNSSYIVSIDGEGVTDADGTHRYTYLAASTGDDVLQLKGTLSTVKCFEFLLDLRQQNPGGLFCIFSGNYDVNMMLVDVPREKLQQLHEGKRIEWGDYEIEYRPRKEFVVRRYSEERWKWDAERKKYYPNFETMVRVWDVFGFFQGSLVKSLKDYGYDAEKTERIHSMKIQRGTFTEKSFRKLVVPYCKMELEALVWLMNRLRDYLHAAGLALSRYDGAGAIAAALMKKYKIKDFHGRHTPPGVNRASQYAFAGGRIECMQYGHHAGRVWHYDLRSAYPAALLRVPALHNGTWHQLKHMSVDKARQLLTLSDFALFDIEFNFPDGLPLYPFFVRDPLGQIAFPRSGRNWYWGPELAAALEHMPELSFTIHGAYVYETPELIHPFSFLPELFALRARWKEEGNGAEKVLKLGINSLYGKLIQKLGYRPENTPRGGGAPPFFQLQWAGYTTAYTRAQMYRAAMQKPTSVICIATDGIFCTEPLELPCAKELGNWEPFEHTSMTIVTSGVYWYTNDDGSERNYYRGFDEDSLSRERVLDAWRNRQHSLTVKATRFITMASALQGPERWALWRHWHQCDRELALDFVYTAKRHDLGIPKSRRKSKKKGNTQAEPLDFIWGNETPADRLYQTAPREDLTGHSLQYELPWEHLYEGQDLIDGTPMSVFLAEVDAAYA